MENKLIIANWKLNSNKEFIDDYIASIHTHSDAIMKTGHEFIICPPAIYLDYLVGYNNLGVFKLAGQDCSVKIEGAYTGEISAAMLKDCKCSYALVGHSERRNIFNDSLEDIKLKFANIKSNDMIPILCVGETFSQKSAGETDVVLYKQIDTALDGIKEIDELIIAYEPVWAIGSGNTPDFSEISQIHEKIINFISNHSKVIAKNVKILYGGSVKSDNAAEILQHENVDGVLIGGASLKAAEIINILKS